MNMEKLLGKIYSELSSVSFLVLIIMIVNMTSCSRLGDIERALKNTEQLEGKE